jgi:hypothetical protein
MGRAKLKGDGGCGVKPVISLECASSMFYNTSIFMFFNNMKRTVQLKKTMPPTFFTSRKKRFQSLNLV